jgi:hypothetical protein
MPKFVNEGEGLETVVIFRLTAADFAALDKQVRDLRIIKVHSANQLARKIVIDYLRERLMYLSEADRHICGP